MNAFYLSQQPKGFQWFNSDKLTELVVGLKAYQVNQCCHILLVLKVYSNLSPATATLLVVSRVKYANYLPGTVLAYSTRKFTNISSI